ncbi:hypothetical protein [Aeromicrobium sp. REDSEA-S32_B7]|uniref:phosphatase domain-containing protein n=1 Tax=Aeromicrobium sp. REDSEA-S32_B7 TaxID=1811526 RepID=UPI000A9FCDAF|nr:hypothetical protein [Aeromicrobium sp. REDSEA-S32_B7]
MTDAVIADLDGTLVDVSSILHHVAGDERDFAAFHSASRDCPPRPEVVEAVRAAHEQGRAVLVVTSREFVWRDLTLDWLQQHDVPYDQLEKDGYRVVEAWEDAEDIADLWRSRGIDVHVVG